MKVERLMQGNVVCCHPGTRMEEAAHLMWDHDCGLLPVVAESGTLQGVITDRDICMSAAMSGKRLADIPVSDAMARSVTSVHPDDDVNLVHRRMRAAQVRRLPVVDESSHVVGIVALSDLCLAAARRGGARTKEQLIDVATTLSTICEHRAPVPA